MPENPKMLGSGMVDCNPQDERCPMDCESCFWADKPEAYHKAYFPTDEEAAGKLVRVNSRHDSNLQRQYVIDSTARYPQRFFNTRIPQFDFPSGVIFTANGKRAIRVECPDTVMAVRVRMASWEAKESAELVEFYAAQGVPVIVTFMRYRHLDCIPYSAQSDYEWGTYLETAYQMAKPAVKVAIMGRFRGMGVTMCGRPWSPLCVDCLNCLHLYWAWVRKHGKGRATCRK